MKLNVPHEVVYCRGRVCHDMAGCSLAEACKYKSSAEEFKERAEIKTVTTAVKEMPALDLDARKESQALPATAPERKAIPMARGVLDYFPAALAEIAKLSKAGNDKHNPGEDLHWARGKSMDHADCIMRHLVDRGRVDPEDGISHSVKVAWRALALLQEECEAKGAPKARGAR